jgi:hypothetical protein
VARNKTVAYAQCACGKRGWYEEGDAGKALGKAQTKRNREGDRVGSRRGLERETRTYYCARGDLFHLTGMGRLRQASPRPSSFVVPMQRASA